MAKRDKDGSGPAPDGSASRKAARRIRRLERRSAELRDLEAKRIRQIQKAQDRRAAVEAELLGLRGDGDVAPGAGARVDDAAPVAVARDGPDSTAAPRAFCMREKVTVEIALPHEMILANGRRAVAGTCPSCGAHVVRIAGLATVPAPTVAAEDGRAATPSEDGARV